MKSDSTDRLSPDLGEAKRFLDTLSQNRNDKFTFQTFGDYHAHGKKNGHLVKIFHGTLIEHTLEFTRLNNAGAGIFVTINETDLKGRKTENIISVRGCFVDDDNGPLPPLALKPTMIVESKGGDHGYWCVSPDQPLNEFTNVQEGLIFRLKTDPAVKDLARVMRLPGFYHRKDPNNPFLVKIKELNPVHYTFDQIRKVYPAPFRRKTRHAENEEKTDSKSDLITFKVWVTGLPIEEKNKKYGGRNQVALLIVREGLGRGFSVPDILPPLLDYCSRSGLEPEEATKILERQSKEHEEKPFEPFFERGQPYGMADGRIVQNKHSKDGPVSVPLCNFTAKISTEETHDDGIERKKCFVISGKHHSGTEFLPVTVPSDRFSSMNWVSEWGVKALVYAGNGVKDHLRVAIMSMSNDAVSRVIYTHIGWRKIELEYLYLHAGGAIGQTGLRKDIEVSTTGKMKDFVLPPPPEGDELKEAVRSSLDLLSAAPKEISYALLAAVYTAPLGEAVIIDFTIFLSGPTGVLKTEVGAICQSHYGAGFHGKNLPANWSSTANSIERIAFLAQHANLLIDDFAPGGTASDVARLHRDADRVLRGAGNKAGRGRLTSTADSRPEYYPRCLPISTGEDIPRGQSLRARLLNLPISPGSIDKGWLTKLQNSGADATLSKSMSAFLQWLAPQIENLKKTLPHRSIELREKARTSSMHLRVPTTIATLMIGLEIFFRFAVEKDVITIAERDSHIAMGWTALCNLGVMQAEHQLGEDPSLKFFSLIEAALIGGQGHLVESRKGCAPERPSLWGWRNVARDKESPRWEPNGRKIGWVSADEVLLHPTMAFAVAQGVARDQGDCLAISPETLWKRLVEKKLIIPSESEKKNTVKRSVEGAEGNRRPRVLLLSNSNPLVSKGGALGETEEKKKSWGAPAAPIAPKKEDVTPKGHRNGATAPVDDAAIDEMLKEHGLM
jgi:hypothetical protein